jgi:hypothetical protein
MTQSLTYRPDQWLQSAASLAMSALLARLDLSQGGRPFFWVDFRHEPPQASHSYWDYCDITGRFVDGLVLARLMTGRRDHAVEEAILRDFLWAQQDPHDGLFYNPEADQVPGAVAGVATGAAAPATADAEMSKYAPDQQATAAARHVDLFCQRAPMLAMTTLLAAEDESMQPRLQRMVQGLAGIAERASERNGDELRFPTYRWAPVLKPGWFQGAQVPEKWMGYRYALLTALARYAQLTGDSVAVDLAAGLARFYMRHGDVPPDGRFHANTHSGGVLPTTVGIARLGIVLGNQAMLDWAHRVYLWVREQTPDFGFLADGLGLEGFFAGTCETCALADLQHLAILLSEAGAGDYWDDVERVARNQLIENQYRDAHALQRALPSITPEVLAMLHGGFECAAYPNRLLTWDGAEGCCIGGGLRALYLTWRGAISQAEHETRVNLGISRSTPAVEVVGHEPWRGQIDARAREPGALFIRAPGHVSPSEVRTQIDGADVSVTWRGRYARFEQLQPGQVATLIYPLRETVRAYQIAGAAYQGIWLGHTMVEIAPAGERYPIYQRRGWLNQSDRIQLGNSAAAADTPDAPVLW